MEAGRALSGEDCMWTKKARLVLGILGKILGWGKGVECREPNRGIKTGSNTGTQSDLGLCVEMVQVSKEQHFRYYFALQWKVKEENTALLAKVLHWIQANFLKLNFLNLQHVYFLYS